MSAEIIQMRDYQNKKDPQRTLESQAIEIMNIAFPAVWPETPEMIPYHYVAPEKDPA